MLITVSNDSLDCSCRRQGGGGDNKNFAEYTLYLCINDWYQVKVYTDCGYIFWLETVESFDLNGSDKSRLML